MVLSPSNIRQISMDSVNIHDMTQLFHNNTRDSLLDGSRSGQKSNLWEKGKALQYVFNLSNFLGGRLVCRDLSSGNAGGEIKIISQFFLSISFLKKLIIEECCLMSVYILQFSINFYFSRAIRPI